MAKDIAKPTLENIADRSGVSIATVSRVVNASGPVSKEVEGRVKQVIEDLGFEPKPRRRKVQDKAMVIACIVSEFLNPSNMVIISGIQEEIEKMGLHLFLVPVSKKSGNSHHNLQVFKNMAVNGIILHHLDIEPNEVLDLWNRSDIPMVVLRKGVSAPNVHCIDTDRENGMYQAARLLLNLNHTEIAYLASSPQFELSKARLRGIQQAFDEAGVSLCPEYHRECLPTVEDGFRVASLLLQFPSKKRPTAIIAYNDLVAIGALHAIRAAGLKVPDDISVVGFDNIPLTSHTNPPLTTVAQPHYQKGRLAVQKLFHRLNGNNTAMEGVTLLDCSLVVRESTGPRPQKA